MAALALGGGLALLVSARPFLTVHAARARPLPDLVAGISGRTLEPAVAGLAVVLLAGAVAVPAVRGRARQVVGVVLAVAAVALGWRALLATTGVGTDRARSLLLSARTGVTLEAGTRVTSLDHPLWPVLAAAGAALALAASLVTARAGHRWSGLGGRYDAPTAEPAVPAHPTAPSDPPAARPTADRTPDRAPDRAPGEPAPDADEAARQRADLALWQSLDRGEDPTARG